MTARYSCHLIRTFNSQCAGSFSDLFIKIQTSLFAIKPFEKETVKVVRKQTGPTGLNVKNFLLIS